MKFSTLLTTIVISSTSITGFLHSRPSKFRQLDLDLKFSSSNSDMFGGSSVKTEEISNKELIKETAPSTSSPQSDRLLTEAQKLRKEAAELEVALREEARAKGLPEEMINKLVPLTPIKSTATKIAEKETKEKSSSSSVPVVKSLSNAGDIRAKLGYLNPGDPIRFTSDLDRIKRGGAITQWNSVILPSNNYNVNMIQLKTKTNIDPVKLRLDDVGYDYFKVFLAALVIGTTLGLGSSFVGGQLGFFLGYSSALIPLTLVGVGSIAPGLIGDVLFRIKIATNEEAKKKYIANNAAKFLVGYVLGLPLASFELSNPSNTLNFFQLRPTDRGEKEDRKYFAQRRFRQSEIACSSVVSVAGSVAECMLYIEANGNSAGDVNTLQELMNAVAEPTVLTPENAQNHIRWSALTAFNILQPRLGVLKELCNAFENETPLEECISIIESM